MLFIFSRETYDSSNQINARMFGDEFGVVEDPATGSANGCLAAYLVKYRYFGSNEINVHVEQGYEIKRPSIIRLRASERDGAFEINVGGKVFLVARGELV
jgi:trans-2,3-dihydro-3-hydroxyanthranilate isomerase